jgi:hypothetical protein
MLYIRHRINTVKDLKTVPSDMGIELDLRYEGDKLILHHDPFVTGELFEDLLKEYNHKMIILNVKTEGIEEEVLRLLKKYNVKDYFFLDVSFPALIKLARSGEKNIAIRFSEYEPIEQCIFVKDMVSWVWVDCFNKLPLDDKIYKELKANFKICLVSPELQKYPIDKIEEFKEIIKNYDIDAICTKVPDVWKK